MLSFMNYKNAVFSAIMSATLFPTALSLAEEFPATDPPTEEKIIDAIGAHEVKSAKISPLAATTEWIYHKTADNIHPNGIEQQQLWFINRARSNPAIEGAWLGTESHADVSNGREFFGVDIAKLQNEFSAISPMPPAAFDRRLYEAARAHSGDLITRDAQDHDNQFDRVTAAGFSWLAVSGVVFSYSKSGLHAHAAFNIDWGDEADGMQTGRGHRAALMSDGKEYANVGISSIHVTDGGKSVGPYVTTGNYAKADESLADHFNRFVVGTVWVDTNSNGWYDDGEGLAGVTVMPSIGAYHAVTAQSGGYAIPITATGAVTIHFSGGSLPTAGSLNTTLSAASKLVDYIPPDVPSATPSQDSFPWTMFLPAISKTGNNTIDCHGEVGGSAYLDNCNLCVAGSTGKSPCTQDCNGDWGGTAAVDACGVCEGDNVTCDFSFERSGSGNIVLDTKTDLMWQDSQPSFQDEAGGIVYCNEKSLDGYDNWRLPTLSELQDFFKRVDADPDFGLNYWGTFSGCTASVAIGGYVKTPVGAERYGGHTGDTINFSGGAAARCVR